MYRDIERYLQDVCEIEAMFKAHDLKEGELDTDLIEELLLDWEQFIGILRDNGDHALANQVYEKIEEIEERLREYENEQIEAEEQAVIEEAGNRLSQSAVDNFITNNMKQKDQAIDIGREHKAEFRLRNREKDFPERLKRLEDKL